MNISRLIFSLATGAICLTLPAMAQTGKGKKEKTWRELVMGSWKIDSLVQVRDGERNSEKADDTKPFLRFLPNNKIVVLENRTVNISSYDLLEGAHGRYLKLDQGMDLNLQIDKVTATKLVLRYTQGAAARDGDGMFMFLSAASFPLDTLKKRLAGNYALPGQRDYTNHDLENRAKELSENKKPYSLSLGENGEMGSYLGGRKDTGTWKLNPDNLELELKGGQVTRRFEIVSYSGKDMKLHPAGTPKDSILDLEGIYPQEEMTDYSSEVAVDTAMAPTIEVAPTEGEYDYRLGDQTELSRSWKGVFVYTDYTEKGDSLRENVRMNLKDNGDITFTMGKKEYKGSWRRLPNRSAMVITMKGKEQIAYYEINHTVDETYVVEEYSTGENIQLIISLIPPKAKTAKTYIFEVSK